MTRGRSLVVHDAAILSNLQISVEDAEEKGKRKIDQAERNPERKNMGRRRSSKLMPESTRAI